MKTIVRILIPLGILGLALFATARLVMSRPKAKKAEVSTLGTLVEVMKVEANDQQIRVHAFGNVVPARQVVLAPEVGGRVNWIHDDLVPGSRFAAGTKLLKIDGRDYALAVEQQEATVARAQTELEIERSRKKIAEREWEVFEKRNQKVGKADALALREPQLKTATVQVKSATSGLRRAKLAVTKTTITAPFNAMLQHKGAELGQMVGPGAPVLTLVGTDAFWVQVSVPVARLSWFDIPGVGGNTVGADVEVEQKVGNEVVRKKGKLIRLLADVDPAGRMARVLVEIPDPLGLKPPDVTTETPADTSLLPLLLGSYVDVTIFGRETGRFVTIPREALRDGDQVYVIADGKLHLEKVEVLWRRRDTVLLASGLEDGEEIIVSPVPGAIEGLAVRTGTPEVDSSGKQASTKSPAEKSTDD